MYGVLEDRRINVVTGNFFTSLLYKTSRFHIAVLLFSNRSQKTSKCGGKNVSHTLARRLVCHATFLFLPHFNVMKLNGEKTELLVLSAQHRPRPAINYLQISNECVQPFTSARNIGVIFDQLMSLEQHVISVR